MTPPIPRRLARRIRPAVAAQAALATALLGVAATGDAARLMPASEPVGSAEAAAQAQRDGQEGQAGEVGGEERGDEPGAGQATQPPPEGDGPPEQDSPNSPALLEEPDAVLEEAMTRLLDGESEVPVYSPVRLSVSVLALDTGLAAGYGSESFDTASIVKVDILAALLLQAQDAGRELTDAERELAEAMIVASDNDAADSLWWSIGGPSGLDAANRRLGLTETRAGSGGTWGLTQTTSADQIALLRAVYGGDSALDTGSRAYIQELMGSVISEQQWGISAASGGEFELKNGWLPRSQTGLWDVNSIGRVTVEGASYLVAVVSDGHASQADGIAAVEAAARAAVDAVSGGAVSDR
ncbi:serine hydrolase [Streptomyces sp. 6N223]|uniref:serine hydrolase n=1 Tax=Streptomyces sp. 6N223 TaxID=3457412 RepID=UPI003FD5F0F3